MDRIRIEIKTDVGFNAVKRLLIDNFQNFKIEVDTGEEYKLGSYNQVIMNEKSEKEEVLNDNSSYKV